jgi:hypothetical protein
VVHRLATSITLYSKQIFLCQSSTQNEVIMSNTENQQSPILYDTPPTISRQYTSYLQQIPLYKQSSADSLCGYYCIWMMKVAYGGLQAYQTWEKEEEKLIKKTLLSGIRWTHIEQELAKTTGWSDTKASKGSIEEIWKQTCVAVQSHNKPSILWLPESRMFPEGHYVVVKGSVEYSIAYKNEEPMVFTNLIVNDPLYGERELSMDEFSIQAIMFPKREKSSERWAFIAPISLL